jgi:hypothetical protein
MINSIRKFFLVCSGASLDLLNQPECKTELPRYSMMGAFVFLTAAFASLSGGFALYTGFKKLVIAIPVGFLWGAFIFVLDRFIVSSIRKREWDEEASFWEKAQAKGSEFLTALPRLVVAVFIAVTVAVPLELKYFEPEITAQIADTNLKAGKAVADTAKEGAPLIATLEKEISDLEADQKRLRDRRNQLRDQRFNEVAGTRGTGFTGIPGIGPEARKREAEYQEASRDLDEFGQKREPAINEKRGQLSTLRADLEERIKREQLTKEQGNGFLARLQALSQLAADGPVRDASWFLVVLLTLIETAPVLIKLLASRGPYEEMLEALEHKISVTKKKEISDFNSDINKELERYEATSDARRMLEEQLMRDALRVESIENLAAHDVHDAQSEIARATVAAWRRKEVQAAKGRDGARPSFV